MSFELNNPTFGQPAPGFIPTYLPNKSVGLSETSPVVYVVEDDRANAYLCKIILEEAGVWNIRTFLNAELALADLKSLVANGEPFPVTILLDINMPAMDGWGFLKEYRNFPEGYKSKTEVCLISSSDHPSDIEKAKGFPEVSKFLAKPISAEDALVLKLNLMKA